MKSFITLVSERLILRNISHNKDAWPQQVYINDAFYKYALGGSGFSKGPMYDQNFSFVCYHKTTGDFVGYLQGYLPTIKEALWIETFLIDRKYLRQGYGREFYEAITELLHQMEPLKKVYLACFDLNVSGKCFWERLDFVKVNETMKYNKQMGQLCNIVIYEKVIDNGPNKEYLNESENPTNLGVQ